MRVRLLLSCLALLLASAAHAAPADPQETQALHGLFERHWEDVSRRFPEGSTFRGDVRYNDRLSDQSAEAIEAYDRQVHQWLSEARAIAGMRN